MSARCRSSVFPLRSSVPVPNVTYVDTSAQELAAPCDPLIAPQHCQPAMYNQGLVDELLALVTNAGLLDPTDLHQLATHTVKQQQMDGHGMRNVQAGQAGGMAPPRLQPTPVAAMLTMKPAPSVLSTQSGKSTIRAPRWADKTWNPRAVMSKAPAVKGTGVFIPAKPDHSAALSSTTLPPTTPSRLQPSSLTHSTRPPSLPHQQSWDSSPLPPQTGPGLYDSWVGWQQLQMTTSCSSSGTLMSGISTDTAVSNPELASIAAQMVSDTPPQASPFSTSRYTVEELLPSGRVTANSSEQWSPHLGTAVSPSRIPQPLYTHLPFPACSEQVEQQLEQQLLALQEALQGAPGSCMGSRMESLQGPLSQGSLSQASLCTPVSPRSLEFPSTFHSAVDMAVNYQQREAKASQLSALIASVQLDSGDGLYQRAHGTW